MDASQRGLKHVCPECATKYYDLMRSVVVCPKCGAKPQASKLARSTQARRKPGGTPFRRYP